jgi:flavin reductase (DIM6/NTAB) family NADH-FMN oxidoreductase RutF
MKEESDGGARVVGEVVNTIADDKILDSKGNIDIDQLQPILLDDSAAAYRAVGEKVGNAFKDGNSYK